MQADAVWVDVLPSMRGFATRMVKDATASGRKAGQAAAKSFDDGAAGLGRQMVRDITAQMESAKAEVEKVSAALQTARDREAVAAGRVRVAEAALEAVRAKAKATDAQKAAAEERLAAAQRTLAAAQRVTTATTARLDQAQAGAAARAKVLSEETARSERITVRLANSLTTIDTSRIDDGAKAMARFGVSASKAASATVVLGSATPAVAGLGAALVQAAGAAAVLPGAFAAGGVAAGVLKLGVSGIADAVKQWGDPKKFAEAVAELSPAGRAAAVAIRDLRPELMGLRNLVQESLFRGADREIEALANRYLPMLRGKLPVIGGEFAAARSQIAGFVGSGQTVSDVGVILDHTARAVNNLLGAAQPLAQAFRDIAVVGAAAFGDLTMGADTAAADFAAFIADARATGQIDAWIRAGFDTLQDFGELFGNVGGIINTVLGAAQEQGGGVLGLLVQVTGAVLEMLQSARGTEALAVLFSTIRQVVDTLLPGVQAVSGALFEGIIALGPAIPPVAAAFSAVAVAVAPLIPDLARLATVILPILADLVTWLAPALPVLAAGFLAGAVALRGYNIVVTIVRFFQAWAAAQWALNAAMSANPIGLIIAAVVALVAGFIYLWNNVEGFRNFWIGVWDAIRGAAIWVWENALRPAFNGIVTAARAVGEAAVWLWGRMTAAWNAIAVAATWLWQTVLKPIFDGISLAARILAAIIITVFVTPAVVAFNLLAAAATWLWQTIFQSVFTAIGEKVSWLWTYVFQPAINFIMAGIRGWGMILSWLWTEKVQPTLAAIGDFFSWLWTTAIRPTIGLIMNGIRDWAALLSWLWDVVGTRVFGSVGAGITAVGEAFAWAWNTLIKPSWDSLGAAISWVWETVLSKVFEAIKTAVGTVGEAFGTAVDFIKTAWDRIYDVVSKPIKWVVDIVYNDGIRVVWNKVADLVGLSPLAAINFNSNTGTRGGAARPFAGGGVLPGYAPGRDVVPALLSPGEAVLVPELVRQIGPSNILAANYAASGRPATTDGRHAGGGVVRRYAGGGVVGNLLSWVPGIGDDLAALWRDPVGYIRARSGAAGEWASLVAKMPAKLIADGANWLWGKVKSFFGFSSDEAAAAAGAAGGRPNGWQQMWDIIRAQFPTAILTSAFRPGDPGYHGKGRAIDIAGPMSAINQWIAKVYPNSTQLIYTPGVNLLNGKPFTYNPQTQADHHDHVHWAFDQGGYLPPGVSTVYNGTGAPEPVLTRQQFADLSAAAQRGGAGSTVQVTVPVYPQPRQSETEIGHAAARHAKFALSMAGGPV